MSPYFNIVKPAALTAAELDHLLAWGWYRTQQMIFTTSHLDAEHQHRVHWLRYPVAAIPDMRQHRKMRRRCEAFRVSLQEARTIAPEHIDLHQRYYRAIDFDGATSIQDCLFGNDPPGDSIYDTRCLTLWDGQRLVAVGYFDRGLDSAASILHFYDPEYSRYGLGKWLVLLTVDHLREQGVGYYYPGYVVESLPKMDYKLFLGCQHAQYFDPSAQHWVPFHPSIVQGRVRVKIN
ncbi:MAG: arginyl-tRNA--protein transferase [Cyclobacteriaceae bacterium]|jgi:arginine-tRNA-protein transferase|nr:arginyl-tRNA--protein transferase [Cyclobacteriaceae bacterium]